MTLVSLRTKPIHPEHSVVQTALNSILVHEGAEGGRNECADGVTLIPR